MCVVAWFAVLTCRHAQAKEKDLIVCGRFFWMPIAVQCEGQTASGRPGPGSESRAGQGRALEYY